MDLGGGNFGCPMGIGVANSDYLRGRPVMQMDEVGQRKAGGSGGDYGEPECPGPISWVGPLLSASQFYHMGV